MNRNEFLIVTGLSALVAALLIVQIVFVRMANYDQLRAMQAQQIINQGQVSLKNLQQVALRTAQLSQQTGDQGLKDLMARQQIAIGPAQNQSSSESAPAPSAAPAPASANTHY
jgi:uncharacterized membrane protein YcaP (DUF421 family)